MAVDFRHFFEGVRYLKRVPSERTSFHVYDASQHYLLLSPDRTDPDSFFLYKVARAYVDEAHRRFHGRRVTSGDVRARLKGPSFRALRALQVLVARGDAKLVGRRGKSLTFHVYA